MSWLGLPGFVSVTFRRQLAAVSSSYNHRYTRLSHSAGNKLCSWVLARPGYKPRRIHGCHDWMVMGWYGDEFMVCLVYIVYTNPFNQWFWMVMVMVQMKQHQLTKVKKRGSIGGRFASPKTSIEFQVSSARQDLEWFRRLQNIRWIWYDLIRSDKIWWFDIVIRCDSKVACKARCTVGSGSQWPFQVW